MTGDRSSPRWAIRALVAAALCGGAVAFSGAVTAAAPTQAGPGACLAADTDGDGVCDLAEVGDSDGDGTLDVDDPDDDDDGIPTLSEQADPNGDGNPIDAVDTDHDGTPDHLDPVTEATRARAISTRTWAGAELGLTPAAGDELGRAVAAIGDVDGDGFVDVVVGSPGDDTDGADAGRAWIVRLDGDGAPIETITLAHPNPTAGDRYGASVASAGDVDGNGTVDVLVGAPETGIFDQGVLHLLLLDTDTTVLSAVELDAASFAIIGPSSTDMRLGSAAALLDDLDGDGRRELAVGADGWNDGGTGRGAVIVFSVDGTGTVTGNTLLAESTVAGGLGLSDGDAFGASLAALDDPDGDGIPEIAVGAPGTDGLGIDRGAVHLLELDTDGTVLGAARIDGTTTGLVGALADGDGFGASVANLGPLDTNRPAVLVGAPGSDDGALDAGATHLLQLDGTAVPSSVVSWSATDGGPFAPVAGDALGAAATALGDLDGDGALDLAVGSPGRSGTGAVTVVRLERSGTVTVNSGGDEADANPGDGWCAAAVLNTDNEPACTLRAALDEAAAGDVDRIEFAVPAADPAIVTGPDGVVITPATPLPVIGNPLVIDATTQDPASSTPPVELDGSVAAAGDGLNATATLEVRGLAVHSWAGVGIDLGGADSLVIDSHVGVARDGVTAGGNGQWGVRIRAATTAVRDSIVSANTSGGIAADAGATDVAVHGNRIGLDLSDGAAGNGGPGVLVVDATGARIGTVFTRNTIGSNTAAGVELDGAADVEIEANRIGVASDAVSSRPNLGHGVLVTGTATDIVVGGPSPVASNTIATNGLDGVEVAGTADGVVVMGNELRDNGGLGLDLVDAGDAPTGLTPNDPGDGDTGPNGLLNHPVIVSAEALTATAEVVLSVDVPAGTHRIEVFGNPAGADPSGSGEGQDLVGSVDVTSPGTGAVSASLTVPAVAGDLLTATATLLDPVDPVATSEFSPAVAVVGDTDGDGLLDGYENGDTDGDTVLDVDDPDDDGDAAPTADENADPDGDGRPFDALDTDGDGTPDHRDPFTFPTLATPDATTLITDGEGGFTGTVGNGDHFGQALVAVGDLDGNGVVDLAVGRPGADVGGAEAGAVDIVLLDPTGSVIGEHRIDAGSWPGAGLQAGDGFGSALAALQGIDADGRTELAIGAPGTDGAGVDRGAVYIVSLAADGSIESGIRLDETHPALTGEVDDGDRFGAALAATGDRSGNGIGDLAVGLPGADDGGNDRGAVLLVDLDRDLTPTVASRLASSPVGTLTTLADGDAFGSAITVIDDRTGDGVAELVVGAPGDDGLGTDRGAIHPILVNAAGTVLAAWEWTNDQLDGPALADGDAFGSSLGRLGDIDGDGLVDIAVGLPGRDTGGTDRGAVFVTGLVGTPPIDVQGILDDTTVTGLADGDAFGVAVAALGDLDGDGALDLVVGAPDDDTAGTNAGAIHVLRLTLDPDAQVNDTGDAPDADPLDGRCDTGGVTVHGQPSCTLRAAIQHHDGGTTSSTIRFAIPAADAGNAGGEWTIRPATPLPTISRTVHLDGWTQPGATAGTTTFPSAPDLAPTIVIDGSLLGAGDVGLTIAGPASIVEGLAIGNLGGVGADGIHLDPTAADTVVRGTIVGLDADADGAAPLGGSGIVVDADRAVIGGTGDGDGNLVGFATTGLVVTADDVEIVGNLIGTDRTGTLDFGNAADGIRVASGSGTRIGGDGAAGNLVSGNGGHGVVVSSAASGVTIVGNRIGTDLDGTAAVANGDGVLLEAPTVVGGLLTGDRNTISGNDGAGVTVAVGADGSSILGNRIGTDPTGTDPLGNGDVGVEVAASDVVVGGVATTAANVVAHSGTDNIVVLPGAARVAIVGNRLRGSGVGPGDLGIDLGADGITANDVDDLDTGANDLINTPELGSWTTGAGTSDLQYTIDVAAGDYRIEFFTNPGGTDPAGVGEGDVFVGAVELTAHPGGVANETATLPVTDLATVTATLTRRLGPTTLGATSEFSAPAGGTSNQPPNAALVSPVTAAEGGGLTLDASASFDPDGDPITANWDLDGDGDHDDAVGLTPTLTWTDLQNLGLDDDGVRAIEVEIDDGNGAVDTALGLIQIVNTPPVATAIPSGTPVAGQPFALALSTTDPGDDTVISWRITWGDGTSTAVGGATPTVTHTYDRPGLVAPILVEARDEDGRFVQTLAVVPLAGTTDQLVAVEQRAGGDTTVFGSDGPLTTPGAATLDPDGDLLVVSAATDSILRYTPDRVFDAVLATGLSESPRDLLLDTSGNLLVLGDDRILSLDPDTGVVLGDFATGLSSPSAMALAPDGRIWVTEPADERISVIARTGGTPAQTITSFGAASTGRPSGVANVAGRMLVTMAERDTVEAFAVDGTHDERLVDAGEGGLDEPTWIALGADNRIWVSSADEDVLRFDRVSGIAPGSGTGYDGAVPERPGRITPFASLVVTVAADPTLTVNSTGDGDDLDPGDGRCDTGGLNTEGDPECTLRAALTELAAGSADRIEFTIPVTDPGVVSGIAEIRPGSPLPAVSRPVELDATTQPGFVATAAVHPAPVDGRPTVEIDGSATSGDGLVVLADDVTVEGFAIGGFDGAGLVVDGADRTTVVAMMLGVRADGVTRLANDTGLLLRDADDTVVGGSAGTDRNLLLGSGGPAIRLEGTTADTTITGNDLGVDTNDSIRTGGRAGIEVAGSVSRATIGGTNLAEGNRIAGFDRGVTLLDELPAPDRIAVIGNRIWASTTLDLDLGNDGIDPRDLGDTDTGPNEGLNAPFLRITDTTATDTEIAIDLDHTAGTYRIELFANDGGTHPSGSGGGERPVAFVEVNHLGGQASAIATVDVPIAAANPTQLTATVTRRIGGVVRTTSEFSAPPDPPSAVVVNSTADTDDDDPANGLCHTGTTNTNGDPECTLRAAITQANANPNITTIHFDIPTNDPNHTNTTWTITPTTPLPTITTSLNLDATTQPGHNTTPVIALDGAALGSPTSDGLRLQADDTVLRALSIHGFPDKGVVILSGDASVLIGNWIGVRPDGTIDGNDSDGVLTLSAATSVRIGGPAVTDRNVISGNGTGLELLGPDALVQNNLIGTLPDGLTGAGNLVNGVTIDADRAVLDDNVVAANGNQGIRVDGGDDVVITGNLVGVGIDGTTPLGNTWAGIRVDDGTTRIGGELTSDANVIAHNGGAAVALEAPGRTAVVGNHIHDNAGLGIDHERDGVTPNDTGDTDTGANDLLNHPVIVEAMVEGGIVEVLLDLDVPAGIYRIDLFTNPSGADPSGFGEGEVWRSATVINHTGGDRQYLLTTPGTLGEVMTATATAGADDTSFDVTSEFGPPATVLSATVVVNSTADTDDDDPANGLCHTGTTNTNGDPECTLRAAITQANANPNITTIHFDIPTNDPNHTNTTWTITPTTPLPTITTSLNLDATTQPGHNTTPVLRPAIELSGASLGAGSAVLTIGSTFNDVIGPAITDLGTGVTGLRIDGDDVVVVETVIGVSNEGVGPAAPSGTGIEANGDLIVIGGAVPADRVVIAGLERGVVITGADAFVRGTWFGLGPDGTSPRANTIGLVLDGATDAEIGGRNDGEENLFAANTDGLLITGASAPRPVEGNVFGLAADGTDVAGTDRAIVIDTADVVIGGSASGAGNAIVGAASWGIDTTSNATGVVIRGNDIGRRPDGSVGSNANGVRFLADGMLGGTDPTEGNVVTGSTTIGVLVDTPAADVAILGNAVHGNGVLDLDLGGDGVTPNDLGDTDTGANDLFNHPVIVDAPAAAGVARLVVRPEVVPGDYQLEIFRNPTGVHPSGSGGGEQLVRSTTVTVTGTDTVRVGVSGAPGDQFTATFTEIDGPGFGATSEFSAAITATLPPSLEINDLGDGGDLVPGDGACDTGGPLVDGETNCTLRAALEEAAATPAIGSLTFAVPLAARDADGIGWTIRPATPLPNVRNDLAVDGTTQNLLDPSATGPVIHLDASAVNVPGTPGLTLEDRTTLRGLSVTGAGGSGVTASADDAVVQGNWIGLTPAGVVVGNDGNGILVSGTATSTTIGGEQPEDGNVVNGSSFHAIVVSGQAADVSVRHNRIGLLPDGALGTPPALNGIVVDGATARIDVLENDVVGANTAIEITGGADEVVIRTNRLGTAVGLADAPLGTGIHHDASGSADIGGIGDGAGNQIADWVDGGVVIDGSGPVLVLANSLAGTAPAIDLGADGATPNDDTDADTGPNDLLNHPEIFDAVEALDLPGFVDVFFDFDNPAGLYRLEVFTSTDGTTGAQTLVYAEDIELFGTDDVYDVLIAGEPGDLVTATLSDVTRGITSETTPPAAVARANRAPTIEVAVSAGREGDARSLVATIDDLDGDALSVVWDLDGDGVFDDASGRTVDLTWAELRSIGITDDGAFPVAARVDDGFVQSLATATIIVTDRPPETTLAGPTAGVPGQVLRWTRTTVDPGDDEIRTWTVDFGDGTVATFAGDLTTVEHGYTQAGTYTIRITTADVDDLVTGPVEMLTVTVTAPPVVTEPDEVALPRARDDAYQMSEDGVLDIDAVGVLGNDTDPLGRGLVVAVSDAPDRSSSFSLSPDGSFVYRPDPNISGTDRFRYTITDAEGRSDSAEVTIEITAVNDRPVLVGGGSGADDALSTLRIEDDDAIGTYQITIRSDDLDRVEWDLPSSVTVVGRGTDSVVLEGSRPALNQWLSTLIVDTTEGVVVVEFELLDVTNGAAAAPSRQRRAFELGTGELLGLDSEELEPLLTISPSQDEEAEPPEQLAAVVPRIEVGGAQPLAGELLGDAIQELVVNPQVPPRVIAAAVAWLLFVVWALILRRRNPRLVEVVGTTPGEELVARRSSKDGGDPDPESGDAVFAFRWDAQSIETTGRRPRRGHLEVHTPAGPAWVPTDSVRPMDLD